MEELKKSRRKNRGQATDQRRSKKKQINFNREKSTTKISKTIADRKIT